MRRRERERRRRYQDVLDSIARREYELELSETPPPRRGSRTAADAARRWQESASSAPTAWQAAPPD